MSVNQTMYDVTLAQATNLIRLIGSTNTVLVQGHIGSGKSSILKELAKLMPTHRAVYFDCTTKDLGDITIPKINDAMGDDAECVRYIPNEELGLHLEGPIILMIDEFGKANPAVKNAMLRLMLERTGANKKLHRDSIIFATTNLGAEGVGDLLPAHARNRITVVKMGKGTTQDWVDNYAVYNDIDPIVISWALENPQIFDTFENCDKPEDNENIYHPKAVARTSFVTHRSLELASHIIKKREHMSSTELTAALMGTVGVRAAADLSAYTKIAEQVTRLDDIKNTPREAKVPENKTALCMVVHRAIQTVERSWAEAWMTYMDRLPKEAQAMFANAVRRAAEKQGSNNRRLVEMTTNKKYQEWCLANNYIFAADKK